MLMYSVYKKGHGDAAIAGQGVNQEMLMLSGTPHFDIGGSIHIISNNQLGFTTPADRGRSSKYSSDIGKCIEAPIFHVNGDDPEESIWLPKMAAMNNNSKIYILGSGKYYETSF